MSISGHLTHRCLVALGCMALVAVLFTSRSTVHADQLYANDYMQCGNSLHSGNSVYTFECINYYIPAWGYSTYTPHWTGGGGYWNAVLDSPCSCYQYGTHENQHRYAIAASDAIVYMQGDGNLVFYDNSITTAYWDTNTDGNYGAFFNLQDDGNMVVYSSTNVPLWSVY